MTQHKRIGVDVDGVLADFTSAYSALFVETTGRDLFQPKPFEPPCWHYPEKLGYTREEVSAVWQHIKQDDHFWATLPVFEDFDLDALILLTRRYDVYFLTTRVGSTAKRQTELWFGMAFQSEIEPTVLITDNKPYAAIALKLDIVIDDYHMNTQQLALSVPACRTYLLNRSWNRHEHAGIDVVRVDSLDEMIQRESL